MESLPECDWTAFKKIRGEMLEALSARINGKAVRIINRKGMSHHEKYLKLNKHIRKSYKLVGSCFDDCSHANCHLTLLKLRKEGLLADRYLDLFSDTTQEFLKKIEIPEKSQK